MPRPLIRTRRPSRSPMDVMRQGLIDGLFQAPNTRFESQLSRMSWQTFSIGLSSGHFGGSCIRVMFGHDKLLRRAGHTF